METSEIDVANLRLFSLLYVICVIKSVKITTSKAVSLVISHAILFQGCLLQNHGDKEYIFSGKVKESLQIWRIIPIFAMYYNQ